jgi:predicted amidohydrolase YtcJ
LHEHGTLVWTPENLAHAFAPVDAAGYQTHIHAIGNAAVRAALAAINHANSLDRPRERQYQMSPLAKPGAPPAFGSDWPVSPACPLGAWVPAEIITIEAAYLAGAWTHLTPDR